MSRSYFSAVACVIVLGLSLPARADTDVCPVPANLALTDLALPASSKAVAIRHDLKIVALGGASTAGTAAGGPQYAYPARLEMLLRQRLPGVSVEVVNRGAAAGSVRDRVARIGTDLAGIQPDLVIWAPGSTEAGVAEDPDRFQASLAEGVARIRAAGADLMMIDLQYTPMIARSINLLPYDAAIARIAGEDNIGLLRRSALMRHWDETGVLQLDRTPRGGRVAVIRRLFNCVAMALADGIAPAVSLSATR